MNITRKIYDNADSKSLAAEMRRKRFGLFLQLLSTVPRPLTILDLGGRQRFWEVMGFTQEPGIQIVLLNLEQIEVHYDNFSALLGDATGMSAIQNQQFDVVFSNSVIEHVGDYYKQAQMAQEVQRVGKRYFVQTPNYYFPIEPHFLFFAYHWLPVSLRVWLLRRFNLGWTKKTPNAQEARERVEGIRLLKKKELLKLFPNCSLYEERAVGLVKSFVVYGGW